MTKVFENLKEAVNDPAKMNSPELTSEMIQNACLYQLATTMIEIEKDLKHIETELRGIRGRI